MNFLNIVYLQAIYLSQTRCYLLAIAPGTKRKRGSKPLITSPEVGPPCVYFENPTVCPVYHFNSHSLHKFQMFYVSCFMASYSTTTGVVVEERMEGE